MDLFEILIQLIRSEQPLIYGNTQNFIRQSFEDHKNKIKRTNMLAAEILK